MSCIGILLCGGSSQRMGFNKLTAPLGGQSALQRSAALLAQSGCHRLVIAVTEDTRPGAEALNVAVPVTLCAGGKTRGQSVLNALRAADGQPGDIAVIHDAARCFQTQAAVRAAMDSAQKNGSGVAALPMADSVFERETQRPLDRSKMVRTQTPQAFRFDRILSAYEQAGDQAATDDAALYAQYVGPVTFTPGSELGRKLTTPEDWAWAKAMVSVPRIGMGFDTHVLGEGRKLILGGVEIPSEKGLVAHSDGDVLLHALMDALLGAASLGDIGHLFPDRDPQYAGISSRVLLRQVADCLRDRGFTVIHVDVTMICQRPKLAPYFPQARQNIAADLGIPEDGVSLKATTTEGMNDEGRGLCISAQAVATVL